MTTTTTASMALEPLLLLLLMFACCRRYFRITVELSFLAPPPGKDDPPPNLLLPTKPLSDKTSLPPPLRHLLSLLSGDRNTITTALGSSIWLVNTIGDARDSSNARALKVVLSLIGVKEGLKLLSLINLHHPSQHLMKS
ncbi:hypothetical protein OROGR_012077 [Orobanche gracilis]